MKIQRFVYNMFGVNTYVIWDEPTGETAIIDPGMISAHDNSEIENFISTNRLKPRYLINTHLHIDHTLGNEEIMNAYSLPLHANSDDVFLGSNRSRQAEMFGLEMPSLPPVSVGHDLKNGDRLTLGEESVEVIAVPGHSPGSIALYSPDGNFVITGDALFHGSIGRTDLPGGNHPQLIKSIKERLFSLPDNTVVYPGHGDQTTIGYEKKLNPFF
ncbi:MAG: MBL fold metallo-hydrolase [Paramuribaculum sp.]|nr:MBL fold metallo-hydrolase [Paramuribaculum sp.]